MGIVWAELGGRLGLQFLLKRGVERSRRLNRNSREKEGSPRSWNHSVSEKESTAWARLCMPQRRCYGNWILGRFCWSEMKEITWEGSGYREIYKCRVGKSPGGILLSALLSPPRPTQNERRNPSAVNSLVGSTNKKVWNFMPPSTSRLPSGIFSVTTRHPRAHLLKLSWGTRALGREGCEKSQKMENSKSINVCNIKTGFRRKRTRKKTSMTC